MYSPVHYKQFQFVQVAVLGRADGMTGHYSIGWARTGKGNGSAELYPTPSFFIIAWKRGSERSGSFSGSTLKKSSQ